MRWKKQAIKRGKKKLNCVFSFNKYYVVYLFVTFSINFFFSRQIHFREIKKESKF